MTTHNKKHIWKETDVPYMNAINTNRHLFLSHILDKNCCCFFWCFRGKMSWRKKIMWFAHINITASCKYGAFCYDQYTIKIALTLILVSLYNTTLILNSTMIKFKWFFSDQNVNLENLEIHFINKDTIKTSI